MPLPPRLQTELDDISSEYSVHVVEDASHINVILANFRVGRGFNSDTTDVLLKIPRAYPDAGPDMFWTRPGLLLKDGRAPQAADIIEAHVGDQWRRFSWHPSRWNPVNDNLRTYIEFVRERLAKSL
jgi:hypothetical protein